VAKDERYQIAAGGRVADLVLNHLESTGHTIVASNLCQSRLEQTKRK
jgi:hypothetical protein